MESPEQIAYTGRLVCTCGHYRYLHVDGVAACPCGCPEYQRDEDVT